MHRFFLPQIFAEEMKITGKDAHHICNVLRMQIGEKIQIATADSIVALMEITELNNDFVKIKLLEIINEVHEPNVKVTIAQALVKGEKMDYIIQKSIEIGANRIIPIIMNNCVVQLDAKKAEKKITRWNKIAEAAAKQCKRDIIPIVDKVSKFKDVLQEDEFDLKIIASECERQISLKEVLRKNSEAKNILVIIGPEGGITAEELDLASKNNACAISLGKRILRAETASLVALVAIMYETGDLGD